MILLQRILYCKNTKCQQLFQVLEQRLEERGRRENSIKEEQRREEEEEREAERWREEERKEEERVERWRQEEEEERRKVKGGKEVEEAKTLRKKREEAVERRLARSFTRDCQSQTGFTTDSGAFQIFFMLQFFLPPKSHVHTIQVLSVLVTKVYICDPLFPGK